MSGKFSPLRGGSSLFLCIAYLCHEGYIPSQPVFDVGRYDLIFDDGQSLKRIQCKSSRLEGHYPRVRLGNATTQKKYKPTDFDFLWTITNESAYLIPVEYIPLDKDGLLVSISLTPNYDMFKIKFPFLNGRDKNRKITVLRATEQEKARIESLYLSGETPRSIAFVMGLTEKQIENYLVRNKIQKKHFVTPEVKEQIRKLYLDDDLRIGDIALKIGFSRHSVSNVIKELGITKKESKITDEQRHTIIGMAREGKSPLEIAKALGINRPNTISTFLTRHKWLVKDQNPTITSSQK